MDFFENQERARRNTALMVVLFGLAVACTVVILNVAGVVVYAWFTDFEFASMHGLFAGTPRPVYWATTAIVLTVIAWGSVKRLAELSAGGAAVARMVGARVVARDSRDPLERRLLNIVEEMALASGISAPVAYVMDDQASINAFAAGYSPNEAVVAVTRGALQRLSRDELQGVIGHEFSHILNGDMRLNIHLMGVIAGIVTIGTLGAHCMRGNLSSDRSKDNGDFELRLFLFGLLLWILGSVGVLFGNLIKAAVSRQREFLADASSVQFTRNPDGLGGALYKIGRRGSAIVQSSAGELSHMCIGPPAAGVGLFSALSTHPPVKERIARILGEGAERLLADRYRKEPEPPPEPDSGEGHEALAESAGAAADLVSPLDAGTSGAEAWGRVPSQALNTTAQAVLSSVGNPSLEHVDFARRILEAIPEPVREGARSADGARALVCALLLGEGEIRAAQVSAVRAQAGDTVATLAERFNQALKGADPRLRMPLLDLAMPALKVLEQSGREGLLSLVKQLIEADRKVTLAEFTLLTICTRHLAREPKGPPPVKHKSLDTVQAECALVLSLLARAGGGGEPEFRKGMQALDMAGALTPPAQLTFPAVEKALYELKLLAPMRKPAFIKACLATVMADGRLTVAEGELMRALCAALDSPLPPLLDTVEPVVK